ncbi:amino acid ABC transporter substrate-binding protein, partial [Streptococcus sp. SPC0]|nr:amino acid ABC transporter substrate-binding protein [Streptococcus sp. SPC0]
LAKFALKTGEGDAKAVALPKDSGKMLKTVNKVIKRLEKEDKYKVYISDAAKLTGNQVE